VAPMDDNNDEYTQSLEEFFAAFEEFDNLLNSAAAPPPSSGRTGRRSRHCQYRAGHPANW